MDVNKVNLLSYLLALALVCGHSVQCKSLEEFGGQEVGGLPTVGLAEGLKRTGGRVKRILAETDAEPTKSPAESKTVASQVREAARPKHEGLIESIARMGEKLQAHSSGATASDCGLARSKDVSKHSIGSSYAADPSLEQLKIGGHHKDIFKVIGGKVIEAKNHLESKVMDHFGIALPTKLIDKHKEPQKVADTHKGPPKVSGIHQAPPKVKTPPAYGESSPARAGGNVQKIAEPVVSKLDTLRLLVQVIDMLAQLALDDANLANPKLLKLLNSFKGSIVEFKSA